MADLLALLTDLRARLQQQSGEIAALRARVTRLEAVSVGVTAAPATTLSSLPLQAGQGGKVLATDGLRARWVESGNDWGPHTPIGAFGDGVNTGSVGAGLIAYTRVPYAGTITGWSVLATDICTCTIDVWKAAGALPTVADTITAAAKPGLVGASVGASSTLTGWTTEVAVGDVFAFVLEDVPAGVPEQIIIVLEIE